MKLLKYAALLSIMLLPARVRADGVLPVLQTPAPEITETLSYHRAMNYSSTPSAVATNDGCFYYKYSSVSYQDYQMFGCALAQEGFTLSENSFTESGTARVVVSNGSALTLDYNPFYQELTVTYPPRVLAWEVDPEHPYTLDVSQESILPEFPSTISYHRVINKENIPSAESVGEGCWRYEYSDIGYTSYLRFGSALAQEDFTLAESQVTDEGVMEAKVIKDDVELMLAFNPFYQTLRVTYPLGTRPEETDPDNPYILDEGQESLLPEMEQTISMHAVTGLSFTSPERVNEGYRYSYYNASYESYTQFSLKLGEEGFSLVASEKTEEGYDRAVVSDGDVTLTIDYDQENKYAYVTYPIDASPRNSVLFDDYTIIGEGDTVTLLENLTASVTGWEKVDKYVTYYYDNNWIPMAKYFDNEYFSSDTVQRVLVYLRIENNRPDTMSTRYLLNNLGVIYGRNGINYDYGELTSEAKFSTDSDDKLPPKGVITMAVGFALTAEQAEHPENVTVTFTDKNYAIPYAYMLTP